MTRSTAWRDYQQHTAALFRALGLSAAVDVPVDGARGRHQVDVLVEFQNFGISHVWVVECKLWKRRVNKAAVLTFDGVVKDVGAGMAFLLSESGAQSGALTAIRYTNIRITNLEDLRANTEADLQDLRWNELFVRRPKVQAMLSELFVARFVHGVDLTKFGISIIEVMRQSERLAAVEVGLTGVKTKRFPAPYDASLETREHVKAEGVVAFLAGAERTLDEVEAWAENQIRLFRAGPAVAPPQ
jgi:hypothetical protein